MNKHLFLTGLAAAMLMAGCSAGDDVDAPESQRIVIGNSEVPIQFGSISTTIKSSGTRAAVNPDADGDFEYDNIGLFCFATGYINGNETLTPINWVTYNDGKTPDGWSVWVNNALAKAVIKNDNNGVKTTAIEWDNSATTPRYYPAGDYHKYSFGAYFPRTDVWDFIYNDDKPMTARVYYNNIDGSQDISAAWATSTEDKAYSARYYRDNPDADKPLLQFKRLCAKMNFTIQAAAGEMGAENVGVSKVELLEQPQHARLIFKGSKTEEPYIDLKLGSDVPPGTVWQTTGSYILKDLNDAALQPTYVNEANPTTPVAVGQGLFLPIDPTVTKAADYVIPTYQAKVTIVDKTTDAELTYTVYFKPLKALEAGKEYSVNFILHANKTIELVAKLDAYENGGSLYQDGDPLPTE